MDFLFYIGCASAKMNINIQNYKVNTSSELNVYECHKKCSNISDYIGMQQQACYCLSEIHLNEPSSCLNVKECNNFLCYRKKDIYFHKKYQDTVALYALNSKLPSVTLYRKLIIRCCTHMHHTLHH